MTADPRAGAQPARNQPRKYSSDWEETLLDAWRMYFMYDEEANNRKRLHTQVRTWVIRLIWLTSLLAVFSTVNFPFFPLATLIQTNTGWDIGTRLLMAMLPILTASVFAYSNEFIHPVAWIEYRIAAEKIRRQIFEVRVGAGHYEEAAKADDEQQMLVAFLKELDNIVDGIKQIIPAKGITREETRSRLQQRATAPDTQGDDGFGPYTHEQYLNWRVRPELKWYDSKIANDLAAVKYWRIAMLITGGLGSLFGAIGGSWLALIAVASSTTLGISNYVRMRMLGGTFANYYQASIKVNRELRRWWVQSEGTDPDKVALVKLINALEAVFQEERDNWQQQAIQAQIDTEQALVQSLEKGENGGTVA